MRIITIPIVFSLFACGQETEEIEEPEHPSAIETPEPAKTRPSEQEQEVEPPTVTLAPRAEEESFTLELRPEEGGYEQGNLSQFAIHLEGRGQWHLNQEFPFSITVESPEAVQFPKSTLAKSDAVQFTDEHAQFDVPFTPQTQGEHEVRCLVSFAVCNPQTCIPKTQRVALDLSVH